MSKEIQENSSNPLLDKLVAKAKKAQKEYSTFSQEKVDKIFKACAIAINQRRIPIAKMAVEETGRGIVEDKIIKNHFASEYIYNKFKNEKTCGVISEDYAKGIKKVAEPVGVIAGVIPTTNPTSTAAFKALITLKTRNAIVVSPHPAAKKCTYEVCKIINDVAVKNGAPDGLICCIEEPTVELSDGLMKHPDIKLILATGGPAMVKAAYSSGKPALGVGPGNTPVIVDESADVKMTVNQIILSKTFDNGMICASEQSVIVVKNLYEDIKKEFANRGCYILNNEEKKKIGSFIIQDGKLNTKIVGHSAYEIADWAGVKVSENTKILIGEVNDVGTSEPFSYEKLSPVLALYCVESYDEALQKAYDLLQFAGIGHTSCLYIDENTGEDKIKKFYDKIPTGRMLINSPASHGAIGDIFNFSLEPSMTLGCGSWGHNSTSENVGIKHLLNIKSVAARRENMLWYRVPPKIYLKRGCIDLALRDYANIKKTALIVTDGFLFESGMTKNITNVLDSINIRYSIFSEVKPDPILSTVKDALKVANNLKPDLFIALGGGSSIDAAKVVWMLYEHPDTKFEDIAMRFMDIRKRICESPKLGNKADFVAIPTTSGTGSEVTPFAVITDDSTGIKYPLADYALTPSMAIIDANLVMNMPKGLCAATGIDSLTHALESYVSIVATEFTKCNSKETIELVFKYLPASYKEGANNPLAREKMHYAASIAGMAFASGFLGICHSLAHKLGAAFHVPHGFANAMIICQVIKYNANELPHKLPSFSQYPYPDAKRRYAEVADLLKLGGNTEDEKLKLLIDAINKLKKELDIPLSIREYGIPEKEFMAKLDEMVDLAFDDQCTGANPVYPLMKDMKQIYIDAYNGVY